MELQKHWQAVIAAAQAEKKLAREQAIFRLRTRLDARASEAAIMKAWDDVMSSYDDQAEALYDLHRAIVLHTLSGDQ